MKLHALALALILVLAPALSFGGKMVQFCCHCSECENGDEDPCFSGVPDDTGVCQQACASAHCGAALLVDSPCTGCAVIIPFGPKAEAPVLGPLAFVLAALAAALAGGARLIRKRSVG
jgi:hypothetical protein